MWLSSEKVRRSLVIGSELECHRDRDELKGKVRFYLGREDLRIAIGRAAQRRRISDYAWTWRSERVFQQIGLENNQ